MDSVSAILVAGGTGNRFGGEMPKQFQPLAGRQVIDYSLDLFHSLPWIEALVLVLPQDFIGDWKSKLKSRGLDRVRLAPGGLTRQKSVQNGLGILDSQGDWILVHDVARPLVSADMVRRTFEAAKETGAAVTAIPVADTLKKAEDSRFVTKTVSRQNVFSIQTPQAFSRKILEEALKWAEARGLDATDEAGLVEQMGHRVRLVEGSVINFKITKPQDLAMAEAYLEKTMIKASNPAELRIGQGYDVHPFVEGRDLVLGGVHVPFEKGLAGHSDADALLHAICDALLGAAAAGDLGAHFPDSDPKYRGISSLELLKEVSQLIGRQGYQLANIDATLVCQLPKLAPYIPKMRENIASTLKVPLERVSVKATTEEGLGFTGTMQGLAAKAVVLLRSTR